MPQGLHVLEQIDGMIVPAHLEGQRLDRFLHSELPEYSRTDIQKWVEDGGLQIDNNDVRKNCKLKEGMVLQVLKDLKKPDAFVHPEDIPLDILFEDEHLVVLNKPRNMVVHPGNGISTGTLAAALLFHYKKLSGVNGSMRPGIVHRLDKDTPGLMVAARTDQAHILLGQMLENRTIKRTYQCLVWGHTELDGVVDYPIGRDLNNRILMKATPKGRDARTHFKNLELFDFASWLEVQLETGRTHQIRVHMRHLQHSIMGDPHYGGGETWLERVQPLQRQIAQQALKMCPAQMLQAVRLEFVHPITKQEMKFETPLVPDFANVLSFLREHSQLFGVC
jgi:23S rRNA pseudouridine1911/1915/1917 synthase